VAQALAVDLEVEVVVAVLDADVLDARGAEVRAQVLADDALVVLLAALAGSALLQPVVEQITAGLLGRRRVADAAPDLLDFDLVPSQLGLGDLVVRVDGALPLAALVEPADAPFVAVLGGLGHDPAPCSEQGRRSPA
jgi:hypothetical protein